MAETQGREGRGRLATLTVLVVILIVSNASIYTNQQNQINALNGEKNFLQTQVSALESQLDALNSTLQDVKSQRDLLMAPKLVMVNLKKDDVNPSSGNPYLHVYGEVCNVRTNTAYNCRLHVVAYQGSGVEAINAYIVLGTMLGEYWTSVDSGLNIVYNGTPLTYITIIPEWTTTP